MDDPLWYKVNKTKGEVHDIDFYGMGDQTLENPVKELSFCKSDTAQNLTLEIISKKKVHCSNATNCCLTVNSSCCVCLDMEFQVNRIYVNVTCKKIHFHLGMLLTRIDLIFFSVAGTVLCFGFSMRIMLIIH